MAHSGVLSLGEAMTQRPLDHPEPFDGWALHATALVETLDPGVTMRVMRARASLRQAMFMALALISERDSLAVASVTTSPATANVLGRVADLIQQDAPTIVREIFGTVPDGLLAAMSRLGLSPLAQPGTYAHLFTAFAEKDARAKILTQMPGELRHVLEVVLVLDPIVLHPTIAMRVRDLNMARNLNAAIDLARQVCSGVSEDDLHQSLISTNKRHPEDWLEEFLLRRMDRSLRQSPISDDDPDFQPLTDGPSLRKASLDMKNCLKQKPVLVATGKAAYAVARTREIAIELRPIMASAYWIVTQAVCKDNEPLSLADQRWCADRFAERGLLVVAEAANPFQKLARDTNMFDIDLVAFDVDDEQRAAA